jgi:hypothetical protein
MNGARFYDGAKGFLVIDVVILREATDDPTGFVAMERESRRS